MNTATKQTSSRWFRRNLWLHRWTSLIATIPFIILCLTGTILVFHEEIDSLLGVIPHEVAGGSRPFQEAVDDTLRAYPAEKVNFLGVDPEEHPGLLLLTTVPMGDKGFANSTLRFAKIATGQLLPDSFVEGETLTGFLLELHAQWFLGPVGELIGAFIALLILVSLLSGLVVYGPYLRRVALGVFRRGHSARLFQLDLHNFIGVVVLGWALAVTVTGFLLGFGTIATGLWSQGELARVQQQYTGRVIDVRLPPVNVDKAYTAALAAAPEAWRVSSVIWPGTEFSTDRHYTVLINGRGLDERLFRVILVNAETGKVDSMAQLPWYMKAIVLSEPLHFGDYGGLALKLLWTICTWLTLFITLNGAWLWWGRKGKRRRAEVQP